MNMIVNIPTRGHPFDVSQRAAEIVQAVEECNPDALLSFAEHVRDEGLLGCWYDKLTLGTTIAHLIEHYITTDDGRAELKAWAKQVAEDQYEEAVSYAA
ncbi:MULTISPECIES: hypothetical protein [Halomonadaceae]|uniref:hypothetical protein n=1 Tax=Halomonadaceae TaxID=28256 RepID=UPI00159AF42F|nr:MULTISPECIES: hypothetical protein [Halomonas]QJQ93946.1 hypothetical protein HIO72_00630 [Halomonas sp. PA5]